MVEARLAAPIGQAGWLWVTGQTEPVRSPDPGKFIFLGFSNELFDLYEYLLVWLVQSQHFAVL